MSDEHREQVFLHVPLWDQSAEPVVRAVEEVTPPDCIFVTHHADTLRKILARAQSMSLVGVIVIPRIRDLRELLALSPLLSSFHVILLLSDETSTALGDAHRLRPRFIQMLNENYEPLKQVLQRMLSERTPVQTGMPTGRCSESS